MEKPVAPVYWFDAWVEFISMQLAKNLAQQAPKNALLKKLTLTYSEGSVWPDLYEAIWDNNKRPTEPHEYRPDPVNYPHRFFIRWSKSEEGNCLSIPHRHHEEDKVSSLFLKNACDWDPQFYSDSWSIWIPGCLPRLLLDMSIVQVGKLIPTALANEGKHCLKQWEFEVRDYKNNLLNMDMKTIIEQVKEQLNFYFQVDKVFALACALCFERDENKDWFNSIRKAASES